MNMPWEIPPGIPNVMQPGAIPIPTPPGHAAVVAPTPGVLPPPQSLTDLGNLRAFLHQITPVVVTALMALHVAGGDSNKIGVYVALFFALVDPLLSFTSSEDTMRRIVYGLLGVGQVGGAIAILFGGFGAANTIVPLATAGITILSSFLARFYSVTTTLIPAIMPVKGA